MKKFLAKAGTRIRDRWVPRKLIKVCTEKLYIQGEVCGLLIKKRKKPATVIVDKKSHRKSKKFSRAGCRPTLLDS